ncbi:unnamed protein product, partial [Staurois parvus]
FDPVFSNPPLLQLSLIRLQIVQSSRSHAQFGVYLRRVHVINTGPIGTVQTEGQGPCSLIGQSEQNENSSYKL